MKFSKFLLAALVLAVFGLLPAMAQAEVKSRAITLSPMLGKIMMEGDQNVDDGTAYSLGLGYNLTQAFGLEAVFTGANLEDDQTNSSVDLKNYRLDALYHFMPDRALVPYVAVGAGQYDLEKDREFMANYGVGLLYFIEEKIALRADVRHFAITNESNLDHNLVYSAGLKFQFGEPSKPAPVVAAPAVAAPVAAPAPKDRDGDGVIDDLDKCPDTPKGVKVDARGCPLDSDGDGVPDYLDKCPGTPKGIIVDEKGCELKLTLRINFDHDKAEIKPEFKEDIAKAADFVRANPQAPYILLAGHTDSQGEDDYNQKLSERRAAAVRQALIDDHGLDANKLKVRGYGEAQPVADNATPEGRYENRRVEVICCAVLPE